MSILFSETNVPELLFGLNDGLELKNKTTIKKLRFPFRLFK